MVDGATSSGSLRDLYWVVAPRRGGVADEWQISLGYVRGSNVYVRGYLDLRAWSLRLRT